MATNKCAREECGKTVYPIEELKCLDKVWHKQCFKCTVCGMTLSMKTYKGYEKKPYCQAHYPKTVPSAVIDTPDMQRVKLNTAMQSQVKYHENYEKMKGTKIDVADDMETKRLTGLTQQQSQAVYHGELKKKADQDQHREGQPQQPASDLVGGFIPVHNSPSLDSLGSAHSHASSVRQQNDFGTAYSYSTGPTQQYAMYGQPVVDKDSPYTQRIAQQAQGTVVYSSEMGGQVTPGDKPVGSIADYDPMSAETPKQQAGQTKGSQQQQPTKAGPPQAGGFTVKALYDYTAADKDEVSFKEGDVIVNCQKVDEGWLTGTVQRTLMWGMLPANYVEKITQPTGMFRVK